MAKRQNTSSFSGSNILIVILIVIILGLIIGIVVMNNTKGHVRSVKSNNRDVIIEDKGVIDEERNNIVRSNTAKSLTINNIYPISLNRKSPQEDKAYNRVFNPLMYPYKSPPFYKQSYSNLQLPAQVIGCGGRRTPCMGGTQTALINSMPPVDISDNNIAPVNISTQGPIGEPQQVGAIYKIFGNENQVFPLFGRRKYPNDNKWEYYTTVGQYGVKMPVVTPRKNEELGSNETVFVKGQKTPYRVTMYETDFPQYIPYAN